MANVTWDEIRNLRADFLNLQLTETANKLSERNCVELIGLLVKEGLLNVIYTTDGKDIITEQRLIREILDEIYANGGRINIVDLAQHLRIDLSYIENKIGDVCKEDSTLQFTLGQFISADYTNRLIEEITDILLERGLIAFSELIRQFDLPTEYLNSILTNRIIGSSQHNIKYESGTLYTENYVRLQQNILIGYLQGALLPLRVNELIKNTCINENLVQNLIVNLIRENRINGNLIGTTKENSIFYPKLYTDAQAKYIESFFSQNGYIEYSLVRNLGVTDPEGQTKSVLKDRNQILFSTSGCIDLLKFLPQLEMNIESGLVSNEFVDVTTLMPNSFNENDIEKLFKSETSIKELVKSLGGEFMSNTFIIGKELQEKIDKKLDEICQEYAEKESAQCTPQMYASVLQGNITLSSPSVAKGATAKKPTASGGKRKGASKTVEDTNPNQETISFISKDEIKSQIQTINEELPGEIVDLLADNLYSAKSRQYLDLFIQRVKESFTLKETETGNDTTRKSEKKNTQEIIKQLHGNICIFSHSIEQLMAENETNLAENLQRHLIRSLCTDMCDAIIRELDSSANAKTGQLSIEERNKIIQKMSEPNRSQLSKVNESLNGKNVDTTLTRLEDACSELLQLILKRPNKKSEKDLILEIREKLKSKLTDEQDPAMILHLTVTLLFYAVQDGRFIHAPGKSVPALIKFLSKILPTNINQRLHEMQEFVIQQSAAGASTQLSNEKIEFIKKLGLAAKEKMSFASFGSGTNEAS
ncbi:unnamed protein product [Rotaria magnacalcarata]|uniref:E3 UFM1-protein ligase 1 homolog n=1 Tax=Rotaria magnacalcarata TaxID=392030 RepID=A0A816LET7_9BILA|nr:unnamed protein product [Rotaria magnacalcarata]CAF1935287.1 unnamed protein product [Rotaria magnacalcarata]CAF3917932.1 unnamed protein product [Rotaria magnacalcarata]